MHAAQAKRRWHETFAQAAAKAAAKREPNPGRKGLTVCAAAMFFMTRT